jgi:TIR domain
VVKVFLSYRRSDVGGYAGRLGDAVVRHFGAKSVFQDVTAISPGQDFVQAIDRALDKCDAMLAVIGPGWLTASTPTVCPVWRRPTTSSAWSCPGRSNVGCRSSGPCR